MLGNLLFSAALTARSRYRFNRGRGPDLIDLMFFAVVGFGLLCMAAVPFIFLWAILLAFLPPWFAAFMSALIIAGFVHGWRKSGSA